MAWETVKCYTKEMAHRYGKYPRHRKYPPKLLLQFLGLSLLSLTSVYTIALLSRAELRLSGDVLAADPRELGVLEDLQPFDRVEIIRRQPALRLYLLTRGDQQYVAHIVKEGEEWKVEKVEKVHSRR